RDNKELGVYYVRVYTDDSVTFELHDELNTDDFFTATTSRITDMPAYELADGTIITKAIKFDGSGQISFATDVPGLMLELHIRTRKDTDTGARVSIDGEIFDVSNTEVTIITVTLAEAKEYVIKRDNKELGVYYVKVTSKGEILDKVFHNVTFMDGDTQLNVVEVEEGKLITGQTNPTKDGYHFVGWLLGDVIFDLTKDEVTEELVLVAKWEEIVYHSVKFMDGELEIDDLQVEDGKLVSAITEPTKEGFIFVHWALDEQEFDFETVVTKDLVLVAVWEDIDNITFRTVTFMDGETTLEELDVEDGKLITNAPNPTKEGFVLTGWELNGEAFTLDTPVTADLVLVAVWEESSNVPVGTPISTVAEFMEFLNQTSGDYYLANDIDFTGFDPLTNDEKKTFTGTLDGNFKTISNLTRTTERGGLFRSIKGATFKNITFDNVTMVGTNRAGMIAGEAPKDDNVSTFENIVIINSTINGAANNGVGAIVGMGQSNLVINNIKVINTNLSNTAQAAGAIIGQIDGAYNISISDIFIQSVDIEAKSRVGSIYGESKNGAVITISNVVAVNTNIKATESNVAVVAGYHNVDGIGSVSNVFYNGTIEGTSKVAHVVAEKVLESYESVYIANTTITGTLNGTTLTEDSILESIPSEAWWSENLPSITINNLWEFDSTLNVYKLK
ncbi:MAG TPA: hypothetical protein GX742_01270, partial [Acholeplasmataceae bacterium]|nr:hypothetical protein [Acholeplasmataceae bacterium]